ncbi:thiolase family protein [Novosphingobium sp. KCTC 2891]|uniref:thiolase C-terminal domain-containing protein n=1 Tax=unclassified Novosphingobium TaxID=2644732 RepID=UPI0022236ACB|nr:thiolase family protein [Novosphingobium sp. KCTC 2891]MCW1384778.1 thiolase family protein [Novosphingobium sp. KCTC 2891]
MAMAKATITGTGMSDIGRNTHRPAMHHLAEATERALARAGLTLADIDGLCTYPGKADNSPGMSPLGTGEVRGALGLQTRWHCAVPDGPAQMAPIMVAAMAVMTGQARHVLCFRALTESSSQGVGRRASVAGAGKAQIGGWLSWLVPVGAMSAANWAGWMATRYFHEFGMTRDHLGMVATGQRAFALANPAAVMRKPLTLEDYHAARMISDPLGLFDCDVPIDGAAVVIVSAADAAADCRLPPLRIEAMGSALRSSESWDQRPDLTTMGAHDAAADLWARTDFKPGNADVLALYDGFSIFVPLWLEALGFCGHGEAKDFITAGNIGPGGRFPVNTGGGQLSGGRLHGFGLLHEACLQLWGEADGRQVADARTAVCGMGGGFIAGAMLLNRD